MLKTKFKEFSVDSSPCGYSWNRWENAKKQTSQNWPSANLQWGKTDSCQTGVERIEDWTSGAHMTQLLHVPSAGVLKLKGTQEVVGFAGVCEFWGCVYRILPTPTAQVCWFCKIPKTRNLWDKTKRRVSCAPSSLVIETLSSKLCAPLSSIHHWKWTSMKKQIRLKTSALCWHVRASDCSGLLG